jgi:hypothetical protein
MLAARPSALVTKSRLGSWRPPAIVRPLGVDAGWRTGVAGSGSLAVATVVVSSARASPDAPLDG